MGRLDEAIPYARKAYELTRGPTMVDHSGYLLLSMLIDIGDHEIANQLLQDLKAIEPDSPGVAVLEIQLQVARQNLPRASTLVHRSVSEHLHNNALVSLLADYELLIGDVDHARHLYADLAAMPVATGADVDAGLYQSSDLLWGALGAVNFAYLEKIGGESTTTSSLISNALQFIESSKTDYSPLEVNGSVAYVRSQIAALLGDSDMAVDQLRQAVDAGWRRTWYARMDPIMAEVKKDTRFDEILDEVDASLLVMRDRLGTSARRL
jgi:tetratricopeptide (TPR) repeat protein